MKKHFGDKNLEPLRLSRVTISPYPPIPFPHNVANRRNINIIENLEKKDRTILVDDLQIKEVLSFFKNLYTKQDGQRPLIHGLDRGCIL